jgi:hypothetical protein
MALIATDTFKYSHLVKQELWPDNAFCKLVVTANEASAKTYAVGTVLGKVTATGKYKICVQNAADGSQNPAAIAIADQSITAATDTKVLVLARGPAQVSKAALVLDASFGTQGQKDAAYAALEALNIQVLDAI